MNLGKRLRTFLVEPLEAPVCIPAEEPQTEAVLEPEEKQEEVSLSE
jgi:hypothetical protein